MEKQVMMLRFRDLVTEPGGTIIEHRSVIRSYNEVWWGWWMREHESAPREFLASLRTKIDNGVPVLTYLFDVSRKKIYSCNLADIKLSPTVSGMSSPAPERSPEYYHRGRYPAWFLFTSIEEKRFDSIQLIYDFCPTSEEENQSYKSSGNPLSASDALSNDDVIRTFRDLRRIDTTLWVLKDVED